jgi:hypothetical protein
VRVAVERAHVVQAAEDEAVDRLGGQIAFVLRPRCEFGEATPPESSLVTSLPVDSPSMIRGMAMVG